MGGVGVVRRVFELCGFSLLLDERVPSGLGGRASAVGGGEPDAARRRGGLSIAELFVSYVALGGTVDHGALAGYLSGVGAVLDGHQRDIAVHAVNERLGDVGRTDELLAYVSA